jgi:hypothetical protein
VDQNKGPVLARTLATNQIISPEKWTKSWFLFCVKWGASTVLLPPAYRISFVTLRVEERLIVLGTVVAICTTRYDIKEL